VPTYTTPGVYFERVDETPAVAALRTDIAAFVGLAERGPLDRPTRLTSWQQFSSAFGGLSRRAFLAYAVNAFFENGGAVCWVVRVAGFDAAVAGADVLDGAGTPILRVDASSPGTWAHGLEVRIVRSSTAAAATVGTVGEDGLHVDSVAGLAPGTWVELTQPGLPPSLRAVAGVDAVLGLVTVDAPLEPAFDPGRPISVETVEFAIRGYEQGLLVEDHPGVPVLPPPPGSKPVPVAGPLLTISRHPLAPAAPAAYHDPVVADLGFGGGSRSALLAGGKDALASLTRDDFIEGLATLEPVDEVSLVAIPDILVRPLPPVETDPQPPPEVDPCLPCASPPPPPPMPPAPPAEQPPLFSSADVYAVERALVEHCERLHDRVALLDPPFDADVGEVESWRARFDSKYAALYYPWVLVYDAGSPSLVRALPPSGHAAGVCARVDLSVGVHVAPANRELDWAVGVGIDLDAERHGLLNSLGVNCIRPTPGRGIRIVGARTVSSDPSWRFLNVRRLMCMIEEAVEQATQWTVFEPNNFALQDALAISIRSFLEQLWERGALVGETVDDAFFVKCDDDTNPPAQTADGLLLAVVGVAAVRPAEFVIFRIGRAHDELEVIE
jgi:Bacteriophage tail sheath protein